MKEVSGVIDQDLHLHYELELNGMAARNIIVERNGHLVLNGMCAGNLIVEEGASADICGFVVGNVVNKGVLSLLGVVNGDVRNSAGGSASIAKSAVIKGALVRDGS